MSAGAVAAAAMLGLSEAADAHADDRRDVLGQAGRDLTQATQVLDGAPRRRSTPRKLASSPAKRSLQTGSASALLADQESLLSGLPAADQADLTGDDDN